MNNVRDFGAVGNGSVKDTAAIQQAIDAGGMVHFPPGTYLTGTLYLRSNGGLFIEPGATLLGSPDPEDYNADDFCPQNKAHPSENASGAHLIVAVEQENIMICGGGRIDGNRKAFYGADEPPYAGKYQPGTAWNESLKGVWRPGQMIFFCECSNVHLENVQLYNSSYWTCFLHGCEDVFVRGLRILNDQRTANGDGLDVDCCRRVVISDCIIDTGDDCITFRGSCDLLKNPKPCEYATVTNCVLHSRTMAFRFGVGNGIVRNINVSNIVFHNCRDAIGFNSNYSTDPTRGVEIENICFENLQMDADRMFFISSQVRGATPEPAAKEIRNISFRNIRGTFKMPSVICGCAETGIDNFSFSDMKMSCTGTMKIHSSDPVGPYSLWSKEVPDCAIYVAHARNVRFEKCSVDWGDFASEWKYSVMLHRNHGIEIENCSLDKPVCGTIE